MKFKCGLTDEEKKAKREVELHKAKCLIEHGEVVFAWWPIRIKPGDCRWLEKVRCFPEAVKKYHEFGYYWSQDGARSPERVADCSLRYCYESLDRKE